MKVPVEGAKLKKPCSYSFILLVICTFAHIKVGGASSSKHNKCPFQYLYHFGDGVTDIGNSVLVPPCDPGVNPAARDPYGKTYPGWPTGRWSDGLIDFDYASADFGLPKIVPYLLIRDSISYDYDGGISSLARSSVLDRVTGFEVPHIASYLSTNVSIGKYDGVIFSVAGSPVLSSFFFTSRNISIPPYAVPLVDQINWFKIYIDSICPTPTDIAERLKKSLVLMGDIEGNDVGYPLAQGKSIKQVKSYVPFVIHALVKATKELIKMGAPLIIIPGNGPIGCYPYILTALQTNDPTAYDDLGCLKNVNDLILWKNNYLQKAIKDLNKKFPNVTINFGNFYEGVIEIIRQVSSGPNRNTALQACCGIGGKYNYDSQRFCGNWGVPVCPNPEEYIFWDGIYFTQEAYARIEHILIQPALETLNCTSQLSSFRVRK